jgi:hypothetical protein
MSQVFSISGGSTVTIGGYTGGSTYNLSLSQYYIVGKNFIKNGSVDLLSIYYFLFSSMGNNRKLTRESLLEMMSGEDNTVWGHPILLGNGIHNNLYGLLGTPKMITLPTVRDPELADFNSLYESFKSAVASALSGMDISLPDNTTPPNQIEGLLEADSWITPGVYFLPINPIKNTVRRTLAYANYILDSNTVMDADPGEGYKSMFSISDWASNWFINGELRRLFIWPRRRQGGLTNDDAPSCSNAEIGSTSMSSWSIPVWKGMQSYRKNDSSTAWIPFELFAWPCATLYRFYSAASYVDTCTTCDYRSLPIGCFFPLMITSPVSAMGFKGFGRIGLLANYCKSVLKYFPVYGRPYSDDSDGSGVWHGLA